MTKAAARREPPLTGEEIARLKLIQRDDLNYPNYEAMDRAIAYAIQQSLDEVYTHAARLTVGARVRVKDGLGNVGTVVGTATANRTYYLEILWDGCSEPAYWQPSRLECVEDAPAPGER
jgi:hypothetical protein